MWWRDHEAKYPLIIAGLARVYLVIQGTSVSSKRIFPSSGDIVTAQRATLNSDSVDRLIFLRKNLKE